MANGLRLASHTNSDRRLTLRCKVLPGLDLLVPRDTRKHAHLALDNTSSPSRPLPTNRGIPLLVRILDASLYRLFPSGPRTPSRYTASSGTPAQPADALRFDILIIASPSRDADTPPSPSSVCSRTTSLAPRSRPACYVTRSSGHGAGYTWFDEVKAPFAPA
ncbi:hypothetical protein FOMPIDRAFT_93391 [Fomitopsis schrenkii]|uniref:Uncharacterized protein n=1 Tax=Fomitopsis schrenkii TaxID=2126942 RepID=S8DRU2_FOMSC|nr:hypothetical protein FOMPIDRAFT_93391 [Fomitopsis schrenkii]